MRKNTKIKVPQSQFVKEMKDYNGMPYYSFFHNHSVKNKQTGNWEIVERYVINVMNVILKPEMEIEITEIIEAKPQTMKSKDGRDFLNCVLWVNVNVLGDNQNNVNNNYQPQNNQQQYYQPQQQTQAQYQQSANVNEQIVDEDDLPF